MFFFIAGVTTKTEELGNANNLECPACGALAYFTVVVVYEVLYLFFIPVFKWNRRYLAKSSCCDTVFEVEPEAGRVFERNASNTLDPNSLHRTSYYEYDNSGAYCPYCGAELPEQAKFCSQCGRPVK